MAAEPVNTVSYHRRLDRTPEKEFEKLPDSEKKLMCTMRGVLENCRSKVDALKNDLVDKDKAIETERKRRKEAEERLKYLVDPYQSPEVNSELRGRLPRANKSDPMLETRQTESSEEFEAMEQKITRSKSSSPLRGAKAKKKVRRTLSFQTADKQRSRHDEGREGEMQAEDFSTDEEDACPRESRGSHSRTRRGRHPARNLPSQFYSPLLYSLPYYQSLNASPRSSLSSFSGIPYQFQYQPPFSPREMLLPTVPPRIPEVSGSAAGAKGAPPVEGQTQSSNAAAATQDVADGEVGGETGGDPTSYANTTNTTTTTATTTANSTILDGIVKEGSTPTGLQSHSASSISSHYTLPTSLGAGARDVRGPLPTHPYPQVNPPLFAPPPLATGVNGLYGESRSGLQVTMLCEENARLKEEVKRIMETNIQLIESLKLRTQELEALKLQRLAEISSDATVDTESAKKISEFMAEVRAAEKVREKSMEARVKQAEQDKEQFMRELEKFCLHTTVEKRPARALVTSELSSGSETEDSEDSEDEETSGPANNARDQSKSPTRATVLIPDGEGLAALREALKTSELRRIRQLQVCREEMQTVLDQRDQALEQLQSIRKERQLQQLRMPAQREQIMMAKITLLQREKERAEMEARQVKEELVERRLFVSLHKALFPDNNRPRSMMETKTMKGVGSEEYLNNKDLEVKQASLQQEQHLANDNINIYYNAA